MILMMFLVVFWLLIDHMVTNVMKFTTFFYDVQVSLVKQA